MTAEVFITEFLLMLIGSMAFVVFWQLYRTKDGMLRKIMMAYFLAEVFMYVTFGAYWLLRSRGLIHFSINSLLPAWLLPKAIIKIVFLDWIRKNKTLQ